MEIWLHTLEKNEDADADMDIAVESSQDIQFVTADPVVNAIEARIARGEKVDVEKELFGKVLSKVDPSGTMVKDAEDGFNEDYT